MSLPAPWTESLFRRLHVRYGATFERQYDGLDMADVRADWADMLHGFSGEDIRYGLEFLPDKFPPNALEFRAICRRAPRVELPALPAPVADPAMVAAVLAAIRPPTEPVRGSLAQQCIDNIVRLHGPAPGNPAVRAMLVSCRAHVSGAGQALTPGGRTIEDHQLPPAMRRDWVVA